MMYGVCIVVALVEIYRSSAATSTIISRHSASECEGLEGMRTKYVVEGYID